MLAFDFFKYPEQIENNNSGQAIDQTRYDNNFGQAIDQTSYNELRVVPLNNFMTRGIQAIYQLCIYGTV